MVMPVMPPPQGAMQPLPQMGMMGMAPPGPPMDSYGAPGAILDADYRVLLQSAENQVGPPPPPGYIPTSPPEVEDVRAEAHQQCEEHARRVQLQAWMQMRLGMEISAIFASDELYVSLKEIEPQASPLLRIMHDAIINFVAAQTIAYTALAEGMVNREERAAIEAHLTDALREARDVAFRDGMGSFIRTLTADALTGLVALYHAPDPSNERVGQRVYRVDPKVVYPIFGRDGLDRVYTVYDAAYPEVMRDFSDGPQGAGTKAIQKIARQGQGRGKRAFDLDSRHELIGYWDREYALVTWKGQVIREQHHKLWTPPWHIGVPNWRQQAGAKSRGGYALGGNRPGPPIEVNGVSTPYESVNWSAGDRQLDNARLFEPFLMPWLPVADKMEKVQTRLGYGVDRALNAPRVWKRASANSSVGTPEIQNYRDGTTEIEEDEALDILPMSPLNESFEPWLSMFTMEVQAAIPVPILQGQSIGTQASGNAIDVINEMGYAHFAPVVEFMPMLLQEFGHRTLLYKRDWAPAYDPEQGQGFSSRAYGARVKLTREMLERAGCYVECGMSRFSLAGLTAAASTATMLDQQLHLGTRPYWISKFGMSPNPQQLDQDRRDQDLEDAPDYVKAVEIVHLYEQLEEAVALEDMVSANKIKGILQRVVASQATEDAMKQQMAGIGMQQQLEAEAMGLPPGQPPGMLPEGAPVPGGQPPPGQPAPAGNAMPYLSAPQVARATGTEGGAPSAAPPLPGQV